MKLTVLFLLSSITFIHANESFGQLNKMSINVNQLTTADVLDKIENTTGYLFVYNVKSIIKQNIMTYLNFIGLTPYKFYKKTGITRGVLTQNNGMNEENTARFLDCFPDINPEWLLTGKGNMLKNMEGLTYVSEPEEKYGINYKELYLKECYTVELQKKLIAELEEKLGIKRNAG